ncbi:hypothetical protein [Kocuria sp. U4B]
MSNLYELTCRGRRSLVLLGATAVLTGCVSNTAVDLSTLYAGDQAWELTGHPREATGELCAAPQPGCVQGLITDQTHYRKFGSARDAIAWDEQVRGTRDVRRHDAIVLEFVDPTLTEGEKTELFQSIEGIWNSDT